MAKSKNKDSSGLVKYVNVDEVNEKPKHKCGYADNTVAHLIKDTERGEEKKKDGKWKNGTLKLHEPG